jgi:hypothetical protein
MDARHIRTAITLFVLVGLVVAAVVMGWRSLFAPVESDHATTSPNATCTPLKVHKGSRVRSSDVTVSVFNAGTRTGLAAKTMAQLQARGFRPDEVSNAPSGIHVRFVQVWSSEPVDAAARLVGAQFGRHTVVRHLGRLGDGISVVVGNKFKGPVKAPRSVKVRKAQSVCAPT